MRWILFLTAAWALIGCSTTREINITTKPADALISVDGADRGKGQVVESLSFKGDEVHHISAKRLGYRDEDVPLTSQYDKPDLLIELKPRTKQFTVHVEPVPATISVDGKPQGDAPVADTQLILPFTVDANNQPITHTIQVSRPGYQPAEQVVRWDDTTTNFTLTMDLMRKDLVIRTNPTGAAVTIGDKVMGKSPIEAKNFPFPPDPATGQIAPLTVVVNKAGYDPVTTKIDWDNGRRDYEISLVPKSKTIHVTSDPPGADVTIDGKPLEKDSSGNSIARLSFPPTDDRGTPKTYNAVVSKKTADTEWAPEELTIGWDDGKSQYSATLSEVKTRPVDLLKPKAVRTDDGWQLVPEVVKTLGMKDVGEANSEPPTRITELPVGTTIDSLVSSPDGQFLAFAVLSGTTKGNFHSQIQIVKADGSAGTNLFGDGRSLDLTPSFTADGANIVFASNRGGRHVSIWQMATTGEGGITQLTSGDSTDLYPTVDSDPKPRLYYQSFIDTRPDPRIYMTQLGTTLRTDLTQAGGEQPRVSPKADAVIYTAVNAKTGKREIFQISDRGVAPANITNTPNFDSFDPVWSKDGNKIAFVSDRAGDNPDTHTNYDIYILDLKHPDKPIRVTTNNSWDDCPAWDPGGKFLYFRSNRGGSWQVWRIALK